MKASGLTEKVIDNIFKKFLKKEEDWYNFIRLSFLTEDMKSQFISIISERISKLKESDLN